MFEWPDTLEMIFKSVPFIGLEAAYTPFNWTLVGSMVLILLFMGSSLFFENISLKKYPMYKDYINKVSKYMPIRRYDKNK